MVFHTGSSAAGDVCGIAAIVCDQPVAGNLRGPPGGEIAPYPSGPENRISFHCGACSRHGGGDCFSFGKLYGSTTLSEAESVASYRAPDRKARLVKPRIAIPLPHSGDPEYSQRAIPQYERVVELSGAEPVRIPLDRTPTEVMKLIERCDGVLLPGSKADVDPAKFDAERHPQMAAADPKRDTVDELLLQDAYNMRKPVLGICYGLQILNVYRSGTLLQHIESRVNHEAGRQVVVAHGVEIEEGSKLAEILQTTENVRGNAGTGTASSRALPIPVNSSHHQSAELIGDGLKIVARCPEDGIIEALEGTSPDHFVLAVQWHPERSFDEDENSKAIFKALVEAAKQRHEELAGEFEGQSNAGEGPIRLRPGQARAT